VVQRYVYLYYGLALSLPGTFWPVAGALSVAVRRQYSGDDGHEPPEHCAAEPLPQPGHSARWLNSASRLCLVAGAGFCAAATSQPVADFAADYGVYRQPAPDWCQCLCLGAARLRGTQPHLPWPG